MLSAAKSALLASLIAFLLRNEFKFLRKGAIALPEAAARPVAPRADRCGHRRLLGVGARPSVCCLRGAGAPNYKRTTLKSKKLLPPSNVNVL